MSNAQQQHHRSSNNTPCPHTYFEQKRSELMSEIALVRAARAIYDAAPFPFPIETSPPPFLAESSLEEVLQNINRLNRNLESVVAVGNEFSSVEALWSQFETVMEKDDEGGENGGGGEDGEDGDGGGEGMGRDGRGAGERGEEEGEGEGEETTTQRGSSEGRGRR
ncbi:hypothetical protein AJ80_09355 [Polytolypa hystricis UAMH7299]|uniref:DASH complex subunit DAD1 n=1 Tax=Polytolypa hystricis (strain UAMH7299) TaxID=1447883 RepID=A0A2B7WSI1_POLH7|nr:hypothetical protein AJ80_09355 [Polytolypa hystricis UAMH7299]